MADFDSMILPLNDADALRWAYAAYNAKLVAFGYDQDHIGYHSGDGERSDSRDAFDAACRAYYEERRRTEQPNSAPSSAFDLRDKAHVLRTAIAPETLPLDRNIMVSQVAEYLETLAERTGNTEQSKDTTDGQREAHFKVVRDALNHHAAPHHRQQHRDSSPDVRTLVEKDIDGWFASLAELRRREQAFRVTDKQREAILDKVTHYLQNAVCGYKRPSRGMVAQAIDTIIAMVNVGE